MTTIRRALATVAAALFAAPLFAATITVTSTGTAAAVDGQVTLPEAVASINNGSNLNADVTAAGAYGTNDTINFAIPGPGPHTIALTTTQFLQKPMFINGYSQPGSSANTLPVGDNAVLKIVLSGGGSVTRAFSLLPGTPGNTIRGLVINGFTDEAIEVASASNTIAGNFIGTDATGMTTIPNGTNAGSGILLRPLGPTPVTGNVIGGSNPADRNIVSGNGALGGAEIFLTGELGGVIDNTTIAGNYVGVGSDGTTYLAGNPNIKGIRVLQASHTLVGGTTGVTPGGGCTGACNVIFSGWSSVAFEGADTTTDTVGNRVLGNFIGVNAAGTNVLGISFGTGVFVFHVGGGVTIGGPTAAERNVIAGMEFGIFQTDAGTSPLPVTIQGNYLGLNSAGTAAIGGAVVQAEAIYLSGRNVAVGGPAAGQGNIIGWLGNSGVGQAIVLDTADHVTIQGNHIGTLADGVTAAGMNGTAIDVFQGDNVTIGPATPGAAGGNVIRHVGAPAVRILNDSQITLFSNAIFENLPGKPIDLTNTPTPLPNDDCDPDSGPNRLQNYPVLTSAISNGTTVTVSGTLNSTLSSAFTVELFADTAADGQLRTPLGSVVVNTDALCNGTFSATLPLAFAPAMIVRATATDAGGNTSEASAPVAIQLAVPLTVSKSFAPNFVAASFPSTLTIQLTNPNPFAVNGVTITDNYPAGLVNAASPAATNSCGGTLTAAANGGGLTLTGGSLAPGASCSVSVSVLSQSAGLYTNNLPSGSVVAIATPPSSATSATLNVMETIPTLSTYALLLLAAGMALIALLALRAG